MIEAIPYQGDIADIIVRYYGGLMERLFQTTPAPSAIKPNTAYFEQYGRAGYDALHEIIALAKHYEVPLILDAKRGDIGRSSAAYAKAVFEDLQADAVTVSPYMGDDSIMPFVEAGGQAGGVYILCHTSNAGAQRFQHLMIDDRPLYLKTAEAIVEWSKSGAVGAVVGATNITTLSQIDACFAAAKQDIPLLIPGVGTQGGDAQSVLNGLCSDARLHRVNVGSAIANAPQNAPDKDPLDAAFEAAQGFLQDLAL